MMTAKQDIKEQLEKVIKKPETDYNKGVAAGLRIALQFIEYYELDKSIREFRKNA